MLCSRIPLFCWVALLGCNPAKTTDGTDTEPGNLDSADAGWGGFTGSVALDPSVQPPDRLSEIQLIAWVDDTFLFNEGVIPYSLINGLFSDYAQKARTLWIPPGSSITWKDTGPLEFPVGSIISKSFLFAPDMRNLDVDPILVETRLLVKSDAGWHAWPYIWNEDESEAFLDVSGEVRRYSFVDVNGEERTTEYLIPQRNQCVECHEHRSEEGRRSLTLIGPKARNLNHDFAYEDGTKNQLSHLANLGMLVGMPTLSSVDAAFPTHTLFDADLSRVDPLVIEQAARDYLDINCAHCHNPLAVEGQSSQLWLNHDNTDDFHLGICKRPGSAGEGTNGLDYDIVPGAPDESIVHYRTFTEDVGAMMPQIGRSLAHHDSSPIIAAWIENLPPASCSSTDDTGTD